MDSVVAEAVDFAYQAHKWQEREEGVPFRLVDCAWTSCPSTRAAGGWCSEST